MEKEKDIKPISPNDIMDNLSDIIPNVVIEAVNNLLKKEYRGDGVSIKQDKIINEIIRLDNSLTRDFIFKYKYMDFESLYRKNGWDVEYDKPGYNENYDAYFTFSKHK